MSEDGTANCVFAVFTFVCIESDVNKGSIESKHSNFHEFKWLVIALGSKF